MIKKLHGLDGYSFMTTEAKYKYFVEQKINSNIIKYWI